MTRLSKKTFIICSLIILLTGLNIAWLVKNANAFSLDGFLNNLDQEILNSVDGDSVQIKKNSVDIQNNVKASANTGNKNMDNSVNVKTGSSSIEVSVENIVGGDSRDPVDIKISSDGAPIDIKKEINYENEDGSVKIRTVIDAQTLNATSSSGSIERTPNDDRGAEINSGHDDKAESSSTKAKIKAIRLFVAAIKESVKSILKSLFSIIN